ncbi:MAG: hypothetical protein H6581_10975 [Bacteroidia bacterium]|nr:hypothetical protein [Bacteroidia bacterium]
MKYWITGVLMVHFAQLGMGQNEKPHLRWFNAGISDGVSHIHFTFLPSIDLSCRGTTFRVLPLFPVLTMGITQNIVPMARDKQVGFFVASVYYNRFNGNYKFGKLAVLDQDKFTFLAGLKMFFAKRIYAHLQLGAAMVGTRKSDNLLITETGFSKNLQLNAELDVGVYLWPHYNEQTRPR